MPDYSLTKPAIRSAWSPFDASVMYGNPLASGETGDNNWYGTGLGQPGALNRQVAPGGMPMMAAGGQGMGGLAQLLTRLGGGMMGNQGPSDAAPWGGLATGGADPLRSTMPMRGGGSPQMMMLMRLLGGMR